MKTMHALENSSICRVIDALDKTVISHESKETHIGVTRKLSDSTDFTGSSAHSRAQDHDASYCDTASDDDLFEVGFAMTAASDSKSTSWQCSSEPPKLVENPSTSIESLPIEQFDVRKYRTWVGKNCLHME